ncbi:MAG: hypothetical protein HY770_07265 [Chitinivibrionia bacterium]|nr:hypothetical protein [Chitinivibrionia bacterium]
MQRALTAILTLMCCALLLGLYIGCNRTDTITEANNVTDVPDWQAEFDRALQDANAVVSHMTGNGGLPGPHFNLNIIGVPKQKSADMTGNDGHRIFVKLEGNTKILLNEGEFAVLDANGTDGTAIFQLPAPDTDNDGVTEYTVFARALGKPGGSSTMTTCATDVATDVEYCSIYSSIQIRSTGKSSFVNVSRELLYIYADLNGDGAVERYPLFDEALRDYFWSYDNNGLKLLQLRFYEVPTDVN